MTTHDPPEYVLNHFSSNTKTSPTPVARRGPPSRQSNQTADARIPFLHALRSKAKPRRTRLLLTQLTGMIIKKNRRHRLHTVNIVGTGDINKTPFISTMTLVIAGTGATVVKHTAMLASTSNPAPARRSQAPQVASTCPARSRQIRSQTGITFLLR